MSNQQFSPISPSLSFPNLEEKILQLWKDKDILRSPSNNVL